MNFNKLKHVDNKFLKIVTGASLVILFTYIILDSISDAKFRNMFTTQVMIADLSSQKLVEVEARAFIYSKQVAKVFVLEFIPYLFNFNSSSAITKTRQSLGASYAGDGSINRYYASLITSGALGLIRQNNAVQQVASSFYNLYDNWEYELVDKGDYFEVDCLVPVLLQNFYDNVSNDDIKYTFYNVTFKLFKQYSQANHYFSVVQLAVVSTGRVYTPQEYSKYISTKSYLQDIKKS